MSPLLLLVLPVVVGLVVGWLLGGSLGGLLEIQLRAVWLLWLAAAIQVIQLATGWPIIPAVFGLALLWLALNLTTTPVPARPALIAVLLGAAANGIVIAANGRMPYSPEAAVASGLYSTSTLETPKNVPGDSATSLYWLADVIPISPLAVVISIGDILIAVGVGALVAILMRGGNTVSSSLETEGREP